LNTCAKKKENCRRDKSALARVTRAGYSKKNRQTPDATTDNYREKAAEVERYE
jgi:hypothetical protein